MKPAKPAREPRRARAAAEPERAALLTDLNPEQRAAVEAPPGPLLVLAGAGSGKTRVITRRIAWLVAGGLEPESILAVTFTNKAAAEMRERAAALIGPERAARLALGTFHSICARLLRRHARRVGLSPRFAICDAADQIGAVKSALRELGPAEESMHPGEIQARISLCKNRLLDRERLLDAAQDDRERALARAWEAYEAKKRQTGVIDFDDLLLLALELLRKNPDVLSELRARWRSVLVDEYQDTNAPQYELLRLIAGEHRNVCAVGDDDQSIYGWRGADLGKILSFERDFRGARTVRLETNYRSTDEILAAANRLIAHNRGRHAKTLRSALGPGEPVRTALLPDAEAEAQFVVREVCDLVQGGKARYADCAVLLRGAAQMTAFEAELRARAVPYRLVGGSSFFDRKEVRDVLAYLRLVANPRDELSLLRIVNCPPRGVGETSIERALAWAGERGLSAAAAFERAGEIPGLSAGALAGVHGLRKVLAELGRREPGRELPGFVRALLDQVGYAAELERCYPEPLARQARAASVDEVIRLAERYAARSDAPALAGFLEQLALTAYDEVEREDGGAAPDALALMTLHSAKGLEFPRVWLAGVEEGLIPHARSIAEGADGTDGTGGAVEEERRLMYVGITRARRQLTLTMARARAVRGKRLSCQPSRFVFELKGTAPPAGWRAWQARDSGDAGDAEPARARRASRTSART